MVVKCILADLKVEYQPIHERVQQMLRNYSADFDKADLVLPINQKDIDFEREFDKSLSPCLAERAVEKTAAFRKFAEHLPNFDGALFHSCLIKVNDRGIGFTAPSGTGKSTHMMLWQKFLGDKLTIINGDKPLLRFIDNELYAFGSPWMGKEWLGCNEKAQLTDICLIERSEINETKLLSRDEGVTLLMQQIYMPFDPTMRLKTIALVYRIAEKVNFWKIKCNMELEAAEISYKAIFGEDNE